MKQNKNSEIMQTQAQEILSWFGPLDLHPVPKQPRLRFFLSLILYTQIQHLVYHLTKHPLPNVYNSSYTKKNPLLYTKKITLYNSSLWVITKYPISL